jgi:hypothetical protein
MDLSLKSVLWSHATLRHDYDTLSRIVDYFVAGDRVHKEHCTLKILQNIQSTNWQEKYPSRLFVFLVYSSITYTLDGRKYIEMETMLLCQVVELLHYTYFGTGRTNFDDKVKMLYETYYDYHFNTKTGNIIRIIRNNIAHTGAIGGVREKMKSTDMIVIDQLATKSSTTLMEIAFSFNLLVMDMVVRTLGLEFNDLARNGLQPYANDHFRGNKKAGN